MFTAVCKKCGTVIATGTVKSALEALVHTECWDKGPRGKDGNHIESPKDYTEVREGVL